MSETHLLHEPADVAAALTLDRLGMPLAPPSLGTGSVARLRQAMARFTDAADHGPRRRAVERAVARLDLAALRRGATICSRDRLSTGCDPAALRSTVPTETLALELGFAESELAQTLIDTELVTRAIGRGETVEARHDAGCDRLLGRLSSHPDGPVAAVSLLYQGFDATAALFDAVVLAEETGEVRRAALDSTTRVATARLTLGDLELWPGDTVRLSLRSEALEFGAGRHRCPGSEVAWAIVRGMTDALAANRRAER